MKKIFRIITTLLSVGCVCALLSASVYAEYKTVINDTFEEYKDGDIPEGWTMSHEDRSSGFWGAVITDPTDSSNKVLALSTAGGTDVRGTRTYKPTAGQVDVTFRCWMTDTTGVYSIGIISNTMQIQTYQRAWNIFNGTTAYAIPNVSINFDNWIDFEYKIDFDDHTYDMYIDGALVAADHLLRDIEKESIDNLWFWSCKDTMLIDDVKIMADGEIKTRYTKIESSKYFVDANKGTLKNVLFETPVEEFYSNIKFVDGAVKKLLNPDGTEYNGRYVIDNLILDISSPEGDQNTQYKITSRWWITSWRTRDYCNTAIVFGNNSNDAMLNGNKNYINPNDLEIKAFVEDGIFYVPLRFVAEQKGKKVLWNAEESAVCIDNIKLYQSNSAVTKNGVDLQLYGKCINKNSTIFVPLKWIEDILNTQTREYGNIAIIKDDVSFVEARIEKLVLNEIAKRF